MQSLRRLLPSLDHLAVFEAAARLKSFTRAGEEIGMTQAAVSYAIRALEQELGAALFIRRHRAVALSDAGERLAGAVTMGLGHIRQSILDVRKASQGDFVTLSVSTAFAAFWLLPKLPAFRERFPSVELRVETTDRDTMVAPDGTTLGVRYGAGVLPGYRRRRLAGEAIYPVCSPGYFRRLTAARPLTDLVGLAQARLIHLEEPYRPCPTWSDWFAAHDIALPASSDALRLNDYALVVQAAIDGQGVALGWRHLLEDHIARGVLVRPVAAEWQTGTDFFVVWNGPLGADAEAVAEWMTAS